MSSDWEVTYDDDDLTATLFLDDEELDTYEYDSDGNYQSESLFCFRQFLETLRFNGVDLAEDEASRLKEEIRDEFHSFTSEFSSMLVRRNAEKAKPEEVVRSILNNECSFSQNTIDAILERIRRGQRSFVPGEDKVPKNIGYITANGTKYYSRISAICLLSGTDVKSFERAFSDSKQLVIVAFELPNRNSILAFGLQFVNYSNEDRTVRYYSGTSIRTLTLSDSSNTSVVIYNLKNCNLQIFSTSRLSGTLNPALSYYLRQQNLIAQKADTVKISVNLALYREYHDNFLKIAVEELRCIVPVFGTPERLKSLSLLVVDQNGKDSKYDFYDCPLRPVSKDNTEKHLKALKDQKVDVPSSTQLALIDMSELSNNELFLFRKILTDSQFISCTIVNNTEGDKVRLRRIISGIENALTDNVSNPDLVEMICTNRIEAACDPSLKRYVPNESYIKSLQTLYPVLANNREQLIAVDKILQMRNNDVDLMLVQGPPGTGKTELILALAKELSKTRCNTLITSNVHVACDNIVNRFKNNKELVLKRYTTIYGDQYKREIEENKKKYVENQVLEGFKFNDELIDFQTTQEKISSFQNSALERISLISRRKEEYDGKLRRYKDLEEKARTLQLTKEAHLQNLKTTEDELAKLRGSQTENPLQKNLERIRKSKEESLRRQEERYNPAAEKVRCLARQLDDLNYQITVWQKAYDENAKEYTELKVKIERLSQKVTNLENHLRFLDHLSFEDVLREIQNHFAKTTAFSSEYYGPLVKFALPDITTLAEIYRVLMQDSGFNSESDMCSQTLEFLYFRCQEPCLSKVLNGSILSLMEPLYQYQSISSSKRGMMKAFPFVKENGHSYQYYEECRQKVNREFKKITCGFPEAISCFLNKETLIENIQIEKNTLVDEYNRIHTQIAPMSSRFATLEENSKSLFQKISQANIKAHKLNGELADARAVVKEMEGPFADAKAALAKAENDLETYLNILLSNPGRLDSLQKQTERLKELLLQDEREIETNDRELRLEKENHADIIRTSKNFINKLHNDVNNIRKEITAYQNTTQLIGSKLGTMTENGWSKEAALSFLSDYTGELEKIAQADSEKAAGYFIGRSTQFDRMFLLSENNDGSLISMTTNQVSSLLTNTDNRDLTFDYVIIDEASKCRFEDLVISLPRIKHLVLIGDFMQLDPMYDRYDNLDFEDQKTLSRDAWDSLNRSSFSTLLAQFVDYNEKFKVTGFDENPYVAVMKRQYRMNTGIFNLIRPIYSIHPGIELIDEKKVTANDIMCIQVNGKEEPSGEKSFANALEEDYIITFLKQFQANRDQYPDIKTIGVITGYRPQENHLRRSLESTRIPGIQIGTFDRFQGREYDLVLISLVRTEKLGFTNNIRRMNVAFSRAKSHLLIFGNFEALNKISEKTVNFEDEYSNNNINENSFVKKNMIPYLYRQREEFISKEEMVETVMQFLKENDYD